MKARSFLMTLVVTALVTLVSIPAHLYAANCDEISIKNTNDCTEFVTIITNAGSFGPFVFPPNVTISKAMGADECLIAFKINGCTINVPSDCSAFPCVEICPGPCPLDVTRFLCRSGDSCCDWEIQ